MKKRLLTIVSWAVCATTVFAQTNPAITSWLQNTTTTGTYYTTAGGSTAISNGILVNCQSVKYSTSYVYVATKGIPSYPTGPFQDGNPNQAGNQNAIFKFPLSGTQNTGTKTATTAGNIGVFINGVALFDYRDGVSYSLTSGTDKGGPIGGTGDGVWNRDAIVAERSGFDCVKGHPAGTNYHHHQNPSPFDLDLSVISTVCTLYDANGLYTINSSVHSPLLGFAYDGFPIYGAYGYANTDGTGGITRMKSSYQLRNITVRTHYANGTNVTDGPAVSASYPLGKYREDYEYVSNAGQDYLDAYNGRTCKTPEYPNGTYAYFCTVDASHNSAYPYVVGPTFYGTVVAAKVASITETVTTYTAVLPINLIHFQGKLEDKNAVLDWTVASEINNNHYIIERSTDGLHFEEVGKVKSKGNQTQKTAYTFVDENTPTGKLYYRLKQVDFDGKSETFKVISLLNTYGGFGFKVFPNPVSELLVIQTDDIIRTDVHIALVNALGVAVMKKDFLAGSSNCFFDTQTLYSGIYQLVITENGVAKTQEIVIQK